MADERGYGIQWIKPSEKEAFKRWLDDTVLAIGIVDKDRYETLAEVEKRAPDGPFAAQFAGMNHEQRMRWVWGSYGRVEAASYFTPDEVIPCTAVFDDPNDRPTVTWEFFQTWSSRLAEARRFEEQREARHAAAEARRRSFIREYYARRAQQHGS